MLQCSVILVERQGLTTGLPAIFVLLILSFDATRLDGVYRDGVCCRLRDWWIGAYSLVGH